MNRDPLDLDRLAALLDQAASSAMHDWISSAHQDDLKTLIGALEAINNRCYREMAGRAWGMYPSTYRRGSLA